LIYIAYVFGYRAGIPKVLEYDFMVKSMNGRGFGGNWMMFIGIVEILGAIALFIPQLRSLSLTLLFPLAIGAVTTHFATGESPLKFHRSISMSVLIPIALLLDPYFKIILYNK
ncbi:hypothetical protein DMUE_6441, partial [Dictyocoela muelleri]